MPSERPLSERPRQAPPVRERLDALPKLQEWRALSDPHMQKVFEVWCGKFDRLALKVVPRADWDNAAGRQPFVTNPHGEHVLTIPQDVKVWEIPAVVAILREGVPEQPKADPELEDRLRKLGTLFADAGRYLFDHLADIQAGHETAENMAASFTSFGAHILDEETVFPPAPDAPPLSPERIAQVERWLLGDQAYFKRQGRAAWTSEEDMRRRTIQAFFKVVENQRYRVSPNLEQSPAGQLLMKHVNERLKGLLQEVDAPQEAAFQAVRTRGLDLLRENLGVPDLDQEKSQLVDAAEKQTVLFKDHVRLEARAAEIARLREAGDTDLASAAELALAEEIQNEIATNFLYASGEQGNYAVRDIIQAQKMNCLGSTQVASTLLTKANIPHLQVTFPEHVVIVVRLANGDYHLLDMTPIAGDPQKLEEIRNKLGSIPHADQNLSRWEHRVQNLTELVRQLDEIIEGKRLEPVAFEFRTEAMLPFPLWSGLARADKKRANVAERTQVFHYPKIYIGDTNRLQSAGVLDWMADELEKSKLTEAAVLAQKKACDLLPSPGMLSNLADLLIASGNKKEARDVLNRALRLDPDSTSLYRLLASTFTVPKNLEHLTPDTRRDIRLLQQALDVANELGLSYAVHPGDAKDMQEALYDLRKTNSSRHNFYSELAALYDQGVEQSPSPQQERYLHQSLDASFQACSCAQRLVAFSAGSTIRQKNLTLYKKQLSEHASRLGSHPETTDRLDRDLETLCNNKQDTSARAMLGKRRHEQGNYPEAIRLFEEALVLEPNDKLLLEFLIESARQADDTVRVDKYSQQLKALNQNVSTPTYETTARAA